VALEEQEHGCYLHYLCKQKNNSPHFFDSSTNVIIDDIEVITIANFCQALPSGDIVIRKLRAFSEIIENTDKVGIHDGQAVGI